MPGSTSDQAMGLESRGAGCAEAMEEAACVVMTRVLVEAATALGRISTVCGVKLHEDWSGNPEQERVTNMGAVSETPLTGVTEATTLPDCPAVSESVAGATEI